METSLRSSFLLINTFGEAFILSRLGEKEHRDFPLLAVTWVEEGDKNVVLFISSSFGVVGGGGEFIGMINSLNQCSVAERR